MDPVGGFLAALKNLPIRSVDARLVRCVMPGCLMPCSSGPECGADKGRLPPPRIPARLFGKRHLPPLMGIPELHIVGIEMVGIAGPIVF